MMHCDGSSVVLILLGCLNFCPSCIYNLLLTFVETSLPGCGSSRISKEDSEQRETKQEEENSYNDRRPEGNLKRDENLKSLYDITIKLVYVCFPKEGLLINSVLRTNVDRQVFKAEGSKK